MYMHTVVDHIDCLHACKWLYASVVRGRLSENKLIRKSIVRNICNAKYSRITVLCKYIKMKKRINMQSLIALSPGSPVGIGAGSGTII